MFWICRALSVLVVVLLVGLSDFGDPAFAQGSEDKAQLAQRVVELHKQEGYLERALDAVVRNAPAEQKEAIEELISKLDQDALSARWAKRVEEIFTTEEIKAYLDFMSTDVGRSILRKSTELAIATQEVLAIEILAVMSEE
ncbi:MAG: hypothetical protein V3V97_04460 [Hyphomicrobiaceae bacterium]